MKFVMFYVFLFSIFIIYSNGDQLDDFLKAFDNAYDDLEWVRSVNYRKPTNLARNKRNIVENMLANFESNDPNMSKCNHDVASGDTWYGTFREKELKNGFCGGRHQSPDHKKRKNMSHVVMEQFDPFKGQDRSQDKNNKIDADFDLDSGYPDYDIRKTDYNRGKSRSNSQTAKDPDDRNLVLSMEDDNRIRDDIIKNVKGSSNKKSSDASHGFFNDILSSFRNDKKKSHLKTDHDNDRFVSGPRPLQLNIQLDDLFPEQQKKPDENENIYDGISKRSLLSNEIKLKTSQRLMHHGYGASLPSAALEDPRSQMTLAEVLKEKESKIKNAWDSQGYSEATPLRMGRTLKSIDDYDHIKPSDILETVNQPNPQITCNTQHCADISNLFLKHPESKLFDPIKNAVNQENFPETSEFDDIERSLVPDSNEQTDENTEAMNLNMFARNNWFSSGESGTKNKKKKITESTNLEPAQNNTNATGKNVIIDLSLTLNNIPSSPSTEKNHNVSGELSMQKSQAIVAPYGEKLRNRRFTFTLPKPPTNIKRTINDTVIHDAVHKTSPEDPLDGLITGYLPLQFIKSIYKLTRKNVQLQPVWAALQSNLPLMKKILDSHPMSEISEADHFISAEAMLKRVMEVINSLIEQQVRSRLCLPLHTNLMEFYQMASRSYRINMRQNAAQSQRVCRNGKKNKNKEIEEDNDDAESESTNEHEIFKRNAADSLNVPLIRKKYSTVKKILNQYDYLPVEDQQKFKDLHEMLQFQLVELQNVELNAEKSLKRKRENSNKHSKSDESDDDSKNDEDEEKRSEEFSKIEKLADAIKNVGPVIDD